MARFRFEDLEIWKMAIETADKLFDIADKLDKKHLFRFAEQLKIYITKLLHSVCYSPCELKKTLPMLRPPCDLLGGKCVQKLY